MTIAAAMRHISGTSVQRFLISGPELTITATASIIPGTSVQRFLISGGQFGNRCIHWAHSVDFRAVIPDFKPRLANRCSQKVKTRAIPPAQGLKHCAAAGECRMGRDFGRRSRPWLREREGPAAQRWEGKHRRCAPVRSPCPKADSAAETAQTPQTDPDAGNPADRRQKKSGYSSLTPFSS